MDIVYRRLRDGGVVFDAATWQTHVLTPAAALICEALLESPMDKPLPRGAAERILVRDLDVDPAAPDVRQVLAMLSDLDVVAE
jgi:PqqD family protein of HPr-rel-A system